MLKPLQLERIAKGTANHNRLKIMLLLDEQSDLSLIDIATRLKLDIKNVSEHCRKLAIAGLIMKRHNGREVEHALTKRGQNVLIFFRTLE